MKHGRDASTTEKSNLTYDSEVSRPRPKRGTKRRSAPDAPTALTLYDDESKDRSKDAQSVALDANSTRSSKAAKSGKGERPPKRNHIPREAKKPVNYSSKHHKDDYGIPGFQHKARQLKQGVSGTPTAIPTPQGSGTNTQGKRKKRKATNAALADHSAPHVQSADEVDQLVEEIISNIGRVLAFGRDYQSQLVIGSRPSSRITEDQASVLDDDPIGDLERLAEDSTFARPEEAHERSSTVRGDVASKGFSSRLMIDESGNASVMAGPSEVILRGPSPEQSPDQDPQPLPDISLETWLEQDVASNEHVIANSSSDDV